jgi:hypothetical protein
MTRESSRGPTSDCDPGFHIPVLHGTEAIISLVRRYVQKAVLRQTVFVLSLTQFYARGNVYGDGS